MNAVPTNGELIWWIVWGVLGVLFLLSLPILKNLLEQAEVDRMFDRPDTNIDDMEDRRD